MTLIERATKSANSVADQTVSTVSQIGTAVVAAAVGLIAVVEWPILLAAGGAVVLAGKLKKRSPETSSDEPQQA